MVSKYLGTLGKWDFYVASSFGEYQDKEIVREIQRERYKLITEGSSKKGRLADIFCTAT
jgi:hypothetical protein